jgi:hypothetical protein
VISDGATINNSFGTTTTISVIPSAVWNCWIVAASTYNVSSGSLEAMSFRVLVHLDHQWRAERA